VVTSLLDTGPRRHRGSYQVLGRSAARLRCGKPYLGRPERHAMTNGMPMPGQFGSVDRGAWPIYGLAATWK
jgi:hypothetical protein